MFRCRVPTCFPTPRPCQTTPSLEPATCGPPWSLHATLLLTTIPTRSPRRTARERTHMKHYRLFLDAVWMHKSAQTLRTALKEEEHTNFEFKECLSSWAPLALCTVCVCVCAYTHQERDNRTVYTSICLNNANRLPALQLSVTWTYLYMVSSSCFMFTSLHVNASCLEWHRSWTPHCLHCEDLDL